MKCATQCWDVVSPEVCRTVNTDDCNLCEMKGLCVGSVGYDSWCDCLVKCLLYLAFIHGNDTGLHYTEAVVCVRVCVCKAACERQSMDRDGCPYYNVCHDQSQARRSYAVYSKIKHHIRWQINTLNKPALRYEKHMTNKPHTYVQTQQNWYLHTPWVTNLTLQGESVRDRLRKYDG